MVHWKLLTEIALIFPPTSSSHVQANNICVTGILPIHRDLITDILDRESLSHKWQDS